MSRNANRLLVIDDEAEICNLFGAVAERLGFEVFTTTDPQEFAKQLREFAPTAIIIDLQMPSVDGIEILRSMADDAIEAGILVISGADPRVLSAAERLGATRGLNMLGALQKPVQLKDLRENLSRTRVGQRGLGASDLGTAINQNELHVVYLPKVALVRDDEWRLEGSEALLRWNHPELGMLMPDEFIPIAEETGLIAPLTDFVLKVAVDKLKHWAELGLALNVAVNVGPQLLNDLDFPDRVSELLASRGVDPSQLILEITETAAMEDRETSMDILTRLRLKGVGLAIDDFGTGYSSLKQLFYMPFTELKIDASFVLEIGESDEARTIVDAMIKLAHNLGMTACCEGVETQVIWDFITKARCDKAQGYLIAKPLGADALTDMARSWGGDEGTQKIVDFVKIHKNRTAIATK